MLSRRCYFRILSLLLAIPLLAVIAPAAQYQGGGMGGGGRRGPMTPNDRLKRLTKALNLTADEQTKIKPVLMDEQKNMGNLRSNSSGDRQAMRDQMMKIQQDANDQIRAVLDDTQKGKFEDMLKAQQQRMQNRRGGGMRGPVGPGGGDNQGGPPPQN